MRSLTAAGILLLLTGCFTYRSLGSVDAAMPAPDTKVEIRLTTSAAAALANQIGPDVLYLRGDAVSADATALTLAITESETARHTSTTWKGEHVTVPREDIASVSQRRLAVGATALIGGLAGGGLVVAATAFSASSSSTGSNGVKPPVGVQ
jgi:hypothetical protein